ncbi:MAG: copper chaperone PCu(A)C [Rhizobiaceae bacterium]
MHIKEQYGKTRPPAAICLAQTGKIWPIVKYCSNEDASHRDTDAENSNIHYNGTNMTALKRTLTALALTAAIATTGFADEYKIGDITIDKPVARATAPGQKVGGGYAALVNAGSTDDTLVGASADFAGLVEVHEMKMVNDVMKMSTLPDGLPVPAGETVNLVPGGYHIMFRRLKEPLAEGEKRKVTLRFEKAGEVEVEFQVKSIADTMKMKMDGDS